MVKDAPLAICDPKTVDWKDLVPVDRVSPDFDAEVYYLRHSPSQVWNYLKDQTVDEIHFFVNWDSLTGRDGSLRG